ncbi:MAG: ornithine cyclodeaminase [Bacteriovoracaceae bacterium]|jgi:ornithine cyclodeaminase
MVLDQEIIKKSLNYQDYFEIMKACFTDFANDKLKNHPRDVFAIPDNKFIGTMNAFSNITNLATVKVAGIFPGNTKTNLDVHQGAILLFDTNTGEFKAMADTSEITAKRTAAVSAVATDCMAHRSADHLIVFGAGVQAYEHIRAIGKIRKLKKITIVNRSPERGKILMNKLGSNYNCFFIPLKDFISIPENAIVCTTTSSMMPVLLHKMLPNSCHINAVGNCQKEGAEVEASIFKQAYVVVDSKEESLRSAGDIIRARMRFDFPLHDLGQELLLNKKIVGGISVFKSVGLAIEDLYCVQEIFKRELENCSTQKINLGGLRC